MKFNCFDGKVLNLFDELPSGFYDYKNYILIGPKTNRTEQIYILVCFNDDIEGKFKNDSTFSLSTISGDNVSVFGCNLGRQKDWEWYGPYSKYDIGVDTRVFCSCSDDLLVYKDLLVFEDFSIDVYKTEVQEYCLKPIFETNDVGFSDVFGEIFGILPVLIVVLVGFIGIRKGIGFLNGLLRKS